MAPLHAPGLSLHLRNAAARPPDGWQHLIERAQLAERAGVDRLVVSDHVVMGQHLEAYSRPELGGIEGGQQPTDANGHWLEPLTVLAFIAGITSRVRLMTGVLQAALRRPIVLAKATATLDVLSEGRLDLGVGVGWQREEYEGAGLDFSSRGRILDHTLDVCHRLWTEAPVTFDDDRLQVEAITAMPQPYQPGGVPVWVSGTLNPRVLRRIALHGSGWIPWGPDAKQPIAGLERIRRSLEDADRDPSGFQVVGNLPVEKDADGHMDIPRTMEALGPLVEGGITDFRLNGLPSDPSEASDHLAELVPAFRATVGRGNEPAP